MMNELFHQYQSRRRERPDLDQIYQTAGILDADPAQCGWPLTMFPDAGSDGRFSAHVFPENARHACPLSSPDAAGPRGHHGKPGEIEQQNEALRAPLRNPPPARPLTDCRRRRSTQPAQLKRVFENRRRHRGTPKFPTRGTRILPAPPADC